MLLLKNSDKTYLFQSVFFILPFVNRSEGDGRRRARGLSRPCHVHNLHRLTWYKKIKKR